MKNLKSYFDVEYKKNFIGGLDSRIKILLSIWIMYIFFQTKNIFSLLFVVMVSVSMTFVAKISVKTFLKSSVLPMLIMLIPMLLVFLYPTNDKSIISLYFVHVTWNNLYMIIFSISRVFSLFCLSYIMFYTTSVNDITSAIEYFMLPFKKFNFNIREFSMTMALTFRLVSILPDEINKILKVQRSKGANINSKNFIKMVKLIIGMCNSIFFSCYNRAYDLAIAMESRCYSGLKDNSKQYFKLSFFDFIAIILCGSVYLGVLFLNGR